MAILGRYLETGAALTDSRQLARFAATLTPSTAQTFRAAVHLWSEAMIAEMEAKVTPATLGETQAAIMRLGALSKAIHIRPHRGQRAHTWLTADQVKALFDSCGEDLIGVRDRLLLALAITAGLRRGELIALRWQDIVMQPLEGELWPILNVVNGKNNKDRAIPLTLEVDRLMDAWAGRIGGRLGYVLRAVRSGHVQERAGRRVVEHAVRKHGTAIGVPQLRPHDLRRTFAQLLWERTKDLLVVSSLMGHASIDTTRRYLQLDTERKIEAIRSMAWQV